MLIHHGFPGGLKTSIIIAPFGVLHLYTKNVFISFLLGLGFPLTILIFRWRQVWHNAYLQLSWLMLLIGYTQMALFAFNGAPFSSGDFFWGYYVAMPLVYVYSFIEYYKWIECSIKLKIIIDLIKITFIGFILFLHLISGSYYLFKIITGSLPL